jgi:diguanylate cyclase (GGDEF)-like protein
VLLRRSTASSDPVRESGPSKPPRLVLRFAVVTAVGIAIAGAGILLFVRHHGTVQAEGAVAFHARFVADSILRDEVERADFEATVDGERRTQLDRLFRRQVLAGGALRARLLAPDGRVTYSNDHALIGTKAPDALKVREALRGTMVTDVAQIRTPDGSRARALVAYLPVRFGDNSPAGVFELSQDYAPIAESVTKVFIPIAAVLQAVLIALFVSLFPLLHGVTKTLRRQMRKIEHQAVHDDLTTLPNRAYFRKRVEQALRESKEAGSGCTVMLIDLDRFKEVNDTLGHQSGDLLLQELGARLRGLFRSSDIVARLGGDEFGVLSPGAVDVPSARALAERIRQGIEKPFVIDGLTLKVGASVGIALFPEHGEDVETLIRHADVAMYVSKRTHMPKLYAAEDDHYTHDRLALVAGLRRAIEEGELVIHYQPCVHVRTGELRAVEALVRWQHPERGLLAPAEFVQLAEENGLVRQLTAYVLDTALAQLRAWRDQGFDLRLSVNLSGRDVLDLGLPDQVRGLLAKWEIDPSRLELEISENTILTDPARAQVVLTRLSEGNVSVAIDDFGTGYSSLRYLKRLPIDVIKIDKSFVINMASDESDVAIIRSTIDLGHNLGLKVVAEGVETEEAWSQLADLGCDTAQGFYLSRPLDAQALGRWLRKLANAPARAGMRRTGRAGAVVVLGPSAEQPVGQVAPLRAS